MMPLKRKVLLFNISDNIQLRKKRAAVPSLASLILRSQGSVEASLYFGSPLDEARTLMNSLADGMGTGHRLYTWRSMWVDESRFHLGWWDTDVPHMDDATFKRHFRMTKATFDLLVKECASLEKFGWRAVPLRKRIAMAVHRLATGMSFFTQSQQIFKTGTSTAQGIHKEVVQHLSSPDVVNKFIRLPEPSELPRIVAEFESARFMPNAVGAFDGSHFPHITQDVESTVQLNRKGWASILGMGMCKRDLVYTSFKAGWVGCTSDPAAFEESGMCGYMMEELPALPKLRVNTDAMGSLDIPYYALGDGIFKIASTVIIPCVICVRHSCIVASLRSPPPPPPPHVPLQHIPNVQLAGTANASSTPHEPMATCGCIDR